MDKKDILKAYCEIRNTNNSIPDDVLNLMKNSAITTIEKIKSKIGQTIRDKNLKISEEAHKLLGEYGNKDDTFDNIIKRLIKNAKK